MNEQLDQILSLAYALQLAIRGGVSSGVIDGGTFGESLEALAGTVADKLAALTTQDPPATLPVESS